MKIPIIIDLGTIGARHLLLKVHQQLIVYILNYKVKISLLEHIEVFKQLFNEFLNNLQFFLKFYNIYNQQRKHLELLTEHAFDFLINQNHQ